MLATLIAQATEGVWRSATLDYHALAPEIVMAGVVCMVLLLDLLPPRERKDHLGFVSALGVVVTLIVTYWMTFAATGADLRGANLVGARLIGVDLSGEMLRRAREARAVTVAQLAERTKITRHHIENVEGDRFRMLPAPVYLRGIVLSMAAGSLAERNWSHRLRIG